MVRLGFLRATVREFSTDFCADTVSELCHSLPARIGVRQTCAQQTAARLDHHGLTHPFPAVTRHGVSDLMSDDSRETCFIFRDGKNARIDADLAAGQTKRIHLLALEHHKLPLRIWQVLASHSSDALTDALHHRVDGCVLAQGDLLLRFLETRQP